MFISIVNVPKLNVSFLQHGMYFNWMKFCLLSYKYLMDASNWINLSIFYRIAIVVMLVKDFKVIETNVTIE